MKVMILGCNSFSGASTTKALLDKGYQVYGVSRSYRLADHYRAFNDVASNFTFVKLGSNMIPGEIVNICKRYGIYRIINFVAQSMVEESWHNPQDWYETNCVWLSKLISELDSWGKVDKFIQFSTPEVYGSTADWIKENFDFNPTTPYAISRAAGDLHLKAMYLARSFPVIFTRAANIYGPFQPRYRIVPRAILSSIFGEKIFLHGGGKSVRSFIYAEDVSAALLKILDYGEIGNTYHISTKEVVTIFDLVKLIFEIRGIDNLDLIEVTNERRGKDKAYLLNTEKIRKELQWSDQVKLQEGLSKTIAWAESNINNLRTAPAEYIHRS